MKTNFRAVAMFAWVVSVQCLSAADDDLAKLAAANNTFSFKLLKQLAAENPSGNLFVSPYSVATALQMAANGAVGQTRIEMQQVLETSTFSSLELNAAWKATTEKLSKDANGILTTANALWYRQGAAVKPDFLEASQRSFSATVKALDFGNAPLAEAQINQWVSDQTHGRVAGIANGLIKPSSTDLILANGIYFKNKWLVPFEAKLTKERPFHSLTGATNNLPMMQMSARFWYRKDSGYQAVHLPYLGYHRAMYVFLPDPGSSPVKVLPQIMNGDWRRVTMRGGSARHGMVVLPKFKLENMLELNPALKKLGMKRAFNNQKTQPAADFSEMFGEPHHISQVRQKAFVEVNEEGTEAVAATTGGIVIMSAERDPPFEMIMDRPFLFAIVDGRSETILFLGLVNNL